jgi:hypothetical protein
MFLFSIGSVVFYFQIFPTLASIIFSTFFNLMAFVPCYVALVLVGDVDVNGIVMLPLEFSHFCIFVLFCFHRFVILSFWFVYLCFNFCFFGVLILFHHYAFKFSCGGTWCCCLLLFCFN